MFEVKTNVTFEEFKEYVRAALAAHRSSETAAFKRNRVIALTISFVACFGAIILLIRLYNTTGEPWIMSALVIMVLFTFYCAYRVINYAIMYRTPKDERLLKKMWENSTKTKGAEYSLTFDNESFTVTSSVFSEILKYSVVLHLIETQTNFYIITGLNQGFIVNKENLSKEQRMFVRTHCSSEEKPQITI